MSVRLLRSLRTNFLPNPRRMPMRFGLTCFMYLYCGLMLAPALLFAESVQLGAMTAYSHAPEPGLIKDMRKAEVLVARSELDDRNVRQRIFLTGSYGEYSLFAPSSRHALGVTYPVLYETFLPPSNAAADLVRSDRSSFNQRPLSAVIAHERMHVLLQHHFGLRAVVSSPTWKQEGYCDYIAGSPSVGSAGDGLRLLQSTEAKSPAVIYFRDTLRVRYLLEARHMSVDELFRKDFETEDLDRKAYAFALQQAQLQ